MHYQIKPTAASALREMTSPRYVVIDAAGNIILLIDAGTMLPTAFGRLVRPAVMACEGSTRIDIVGFVSRIDGVVAVSFWNPDGTPERMCGNACRSIPLALQTWLGVDRVPTTFSVLTELCRAMVSTHSDGTTSVEFPIDSIMRLSAENEPVALIDVGTPHAVRMVNELFCEQVNSDGERLSTSRTPVNATFCKVTSTEILARTFERGVGETKSCGTGAIAATMALDGWGVIKHLGNPRTVKFVSGQVLVVAHEANRNSISVTGSCDLVMTGIVSFQEEVGEASIQS